MQNPFAWHDLLTSDVPSAKQFYAKVLGWDYLVSRRDYHVALVDDQGIGGIMPKHEFLQWTPPFWSGCVLTASVDLACAQTEKLGGLIFLEPWEIPGKFRMAVIADPTGGFLNVIQSLSPSKLRRMGDGQLGTVGWNELHAGDVATAWDFYRCMFGWTKGAEFEAGDMGTYQLFQINGKDAGGIVKKQKMLPRPMWLYYFLVNGINAAVTRILTSGGRIAFGPIQVPNGNWIVSAFDSEGGNFQLTSTSP